MLESGKGCVFLTFPLDSFNEIFFFLQQFDPPVLHYLFRMCYYDIKS